MDTFICVECDHWHLDVDQVIAVQNVCGWCLDGVDCGVTDDDVSVLDP